MASPSVPLSRSARKSPCFGCKEKRCRCDQGFPSCGKCQELGRECVYPVPPTTIKLRVPVTTVNTVNPVESDGGRPARRAALSAKETLFAESKSAKVEKKELRTSVAHLSVGEQVLLRIRANRYKRAYASSDGNDPRNAKRKQRASDFPDDEPTCFLCLQPLPKGTAAINQHIDLCLARAESTNPTSTPLPSASKKGKSRAAQPPPPPPPPLTEEYYDEPELETYEWAGQTRVRVTSMLEGGLAAHYGGTVYNKARDQDVDEDVDIDEDETEVFGGVQYTDADVKRYDQGDGEGEEGGGRGDGGVDGGVGEGNDGGVGQVKKEEEEEVDIDEVDMSKELAKFLTSVPSDAKLIIEALTTRLKRLEQESSTSQTHPKCLICFDPYKVPLTSINCWHVHCEQCWLSTLGMKRLCPQCQHITAPSDLRRVYL